MKLLLLDDSPNGGWAHHTTQLANHLAKIPHTSVVVAALHHSDEVKDLLKVPYRIGPLLQTIRRERPDVINFVFSFPPVQLYLMILYNFFFLRASLVYTVHNLERHEYHWLKSPLIRWIQRGFILASHRLIIFTELQRDVLRRWKRPENMILIPQGNHVFFNRGQWSRSRARRDLGIPEYQFVIVSFGAIRPYKGIPLIAEAIKPLKNVLFLIAGKVWEPLRETMNTLAHDPSIRLIDQLVPVEDVEKYFKAADLVVCAYEQTQTNSAGFIDAMSFGVPLIATDCPAFRAFVGDAAYFVPSGDVVAIRNAIQTLHKDGELREEFARRGYVRATTLFSWDVIAKTIHDGIHAR